LIFSGVLTRLLATRLPIGTVAGSTYGRVAQAAVPSSANPTTAVTTNVFFMFAPPQRDSDLELPHVGITGLQASPDEPTFSNG
jgi:hypothetical protein